MPVQQGGCTAWEARDRPPWPEGASFGNGYSAIGWCRSGTTVGAKQARTKIVSLRRSWYALASPLRHRIVAIDRITGMPSPTGRGDVRGVRAMVATGRDRDGECPWRHDGRL
jgi:hypothetical protein